MTAADPDKPRQRKRFLFWLLHAAVICWLSLALLEPPACRPRDEQRPGLAMLVDISKSMSLKDGDSSAAPRFRTAVEGIFSDANLWQRLTERYRLEWYGFAEGLQELEGPQWLHSAEPTGAGTRLADACLQVLDRPRTTPLAGLVLVTDGRSTRPEDDDAVVLQAAAQGVPILGVPIGQADGPALLRLARVAADEHAWIGDMVAVEAVVEGRGLRRLTAAGISVIDVRSGRVLADQRVGLSPDRTRVEAELRFRADQLGELPLEVRLISPDPVPIAAGQRPLAVDVGRPELRVFYAEGYPRRGYRFLRSLLAGRRGIELTVLAGWADERGDWPDLDAYDVVLLGDLEDLAEVLTPERMEGLVHFVGEGGGLGVLAGPRAVPASLFGTPIETLLPVRIPLTAAEVVWPATTAFSPSWTPAGRRSPLLRFGLEAAAGTGLRESLPGFYWHATAGPAKPGAVVLAEAPAGQEAPVPILVLGRYGRGRSLYLGVDETWRWRGHPGGELFSRFWMQALRYLAAGRRAEGEPWMRLTAEPAAGRVGEAVRLRARLSAGQALTGSLAVELFGPDGWRQRLPLLASGGISQELEGMFVPPVAGRLRITCPPPVGWAGPPAELLLDVLGPDPEMDDLRAQPSRLGQLSARTGGEVLRPKQLAEALLQMPAGQTAVLARQESPWFRPIRLGVLVFMLTRLWLLRRGD